MRARLAVCCALAAASVAVVPADAATKAPKLGGACSPKELGRNSGGLVCARKGSKTVWQSAVAPATVPPATTAPGTATTIAAATAPAAAPCAAIKKVNTTTAAAFSGLAGLIMSEKGFDKKHCIELSAVNVASGADIARGMISGDIQIAGNSPPNIIALLDNGLDVVVFGQTLQTSQFDLVIRADYPTPNASLGWQATMKDLARARIGVIARGVAAEEVVRSLFKQAGVDPDGQTYIATGLAPTTLAALQNKQIDAAINVEPTITLAVKNGLGKTSFYLRRNQGPQSLNWPGIYASTTRDYATKNPDVLKAYLAAFEDAVAFIDNPANKAEIYRLLKEKIATDADLADLLFAENKGIFPKSSRIEMDRLQNFLDYSNITGLSLKRRKPSELVFNP